MFVYIYTHTYTRKYILYDFSYMMAENTRHLTQYMISKDWTVAFLGGRGREGSDLG